MLNYIIFCFIMLKYSDFIPHKIRLIFLLYVFCNFKYFSQILTSIVIPVSIVTIASGHLIKSIYFAGFCSISDPVTNQRRQKTVPCLLCQQGLLMLE